MPLKTVHALHRRTLPRNPLPSTNLPPKAPHVSSQGTLLHNLIPSASLVLEESKILGRRLFLRKALESTTITLLAPGILLGHRRSVAFEFAEAAIVCQSDSAITFTFSSIATNAFGSQDAQRAICLSFTQPIVGSVKIVNFDPQALSINYTAKKGFVGLDEMMFHCLVGEQNRSIVLTINITKSEELPPALRTIAVANSTQLAQALAGASHMGPVLPGDHIVMADGNYAGPGDITVKGTADRPIVIRAANLLGARITTNSLSQAADHIMFYGLDFVGAPCLPKNGARFPRIWRCRFRDRPASSFTRAIRLHACTDADIAYCEFTNWAGAGFACSPAGGALRFRVRRCLFRNTPSGFQSNSTEAMLIGLGSADQLVSSQGLIEECRIAGWNSDNETISLKTSDCTIRRVTAEGCSGRLSNRMGQRNLWDAVWVKNGAGIRIHDADNKVLGCKTEGASQGGIRVAAGNAQPGTQDNTKHCLAANTVVAGCDSPLEVGAAFSGHTLPARNTIIRQHTGPITLVPGLQTGTDSQPGAGATGFSWAPLVWLTDADVGPRGA